MRAELETGLRSYFWFYDEERPHQSLDYRTPGEVHRAGIHGAERGKALTNAGGLSGPPLGVHYITRFDPRGRGWSLAPPPSKFWSSLLADQPLFARFPSSLKRASRSTDKPEVTRPERGLFAGASEAGLIVARE